MEVTDKVEFIRCVSQYPALFNPKHVNFNNQKVTVKMWARVAEQCELENVAVGKKLWESLCQTPQISSQESCGTATINSEVFDDIGPTATTEPNDNSQNYCGLRVLELKTLNSENIVETPVIEKSNTQNENMIEPTNLALYNFFFFVYETTALFPKHIQSEVKVKVFAIISEYEEQMLSASLPKNVTMPKENCQVISRKKGNVSEGDNITSGTPEILSEKNHDAYIGFHDNFSEYVEENKNGHERSKDEVSSRSIFEDEVSEMVSTVEQFSGDDDVVMNIQPDSVEQTALKKSKCNASNASKTARISTFQSSEKEKLGKPKVYPRKTSFMCDICGAIFWYTSALKTHLNSHLGIKPYACSICDKRFITGVSMRSHKKRMHCDERPYKCKECDQTFKTLTDLKNHDVRKHIRDPKHICQICNKGFITKTLLKNHLDIHSGSRSYVCSICHKSYIQKQNLVRHQQHHKLKGEL